MSRSPGWRRLGRHFSGESSEQDDLLVAAWGASHPRHRRLLDLLRRAWSRPLEPVDTDAAWHSLRRRIRRPRRRWNGAVAAALTAAAGIVAVLLWDRPAPPPPPPVTVPAPIATAADPTDLRLRDGSLVLLAPGSHLRTAPENDREVWLEGRAFFAIRSDPMHPFVVHTRAGDARVLGTRFVLDARGDSVKLGVVEGRVELDGGGEQVVVGAGRVLRGSFGEPPTAEVNADVSGLTAWIQGVLVFQETGIGQAAHDIERRYGVRIVFPDTTIRTRTITAIFHDQPLDSVLYTVCRALDVRCSQRGDTVEIRP